MLQLKGKEYLHPTPDTETLRRFRTVFFGVSMMPGLAVKGRLYFLAEVIKD